VPVVKVRTSTRPSSAVKRICTVFSNVELRPLIRNGEAMRAPGWGSSTTIDAPLSADDDVVVVAASVVVAAVVVTAAVVVVVTAAVVTTEAAVGATVAAAVVAVVCGGVVVLAGAAVRLDAHAAHVAPSVTARSTADRRPATRSLRTVASCLPSPPASRGREDHATRPVSEAEVAGQAGRNAMSIGGMSPFGVKPRIRP